MTPPQGLNTINLTWDDLYLTVDSYVAMRTGTHVCPITVKTRSSIETRFGVTLIDIIFAVAASESR